MKVPSSWIFTVPPLVVAKVTGAIAAALVAGSTIVIGSASGSVSLPVSELSITWS